MTTADIAVRFRQPAKATLCDLDQLGPWPEPINVNSVKVNDGSSVYVRLRQKKTALAAMTMVTTRYKSAQHFRAKCLQSSRRQSVPWGESRGWQ
jgi:hypothetical protein